MLPCFDHIVAAQKNHAQTIQIFGHIDGVGRGLFLHGQRSPKQALGFYQVPFSRDDQGQLGQPSGCL